MEFDAPGGKSSSGENITSSAKVKAPAPDGRRLRSEQSRLRIVQAFSAFIREGVVAPTAEQVAVRAEVGLRSVFRHFQDMERLYREIALEVDAITAPFLSRKLHSKDWQARVLEMASIRCELFEALMPFQIATLVHQHESPFLADSQRHATRLQRESLMQILPKTFCQDEARVDALDLVMSINSWLRLRVEQGLSADCAGRSVQVAASALIGINLLAK